MILSYGAAIFVHAFNHRLGRIRHNLQELRAEKAHRVARVKDGTVNRDHCITTDFVISLAKLDHSAEARLKVNKTMESDCISAFGY